LRFTFLVVRWSGSTQDTRVFNDALEGWFRVPTST
jgi:hypothetical protein